MKEQRFLWIIVACLFFLPGIALAQVTASVVGTVQDTSGAVIPGTAVTVRNLETGAVRTATTDDRGYYRALSLPVGRYEVAAEKTGFKTAFRTGINLVIEQEAVVNFSLEVGEVQQSVTVAAEAPIVNTTTASTSGLVGEQQVKDLPLNGRSFDNLITLNPGTSNPTAMKAASTAVSPGNMFNISGMRGTDNLFLLNGVEFTAASTAGTTPGGVSGQLLGIDAVREFNVQANAYGAEYGKRAGGQISIVTMSGTNQLHGTIFEFLRNSALDARNFFDQTKPQFRRNGFGGAAGGPIRKDKTFIFGNYEGYRQALTTTNVSFVPDANARRGFLPGPGGTLVNVGLTPGIAPYFAVWPEANGPELGGGIAQAFALAVNPVREDFGTVRLDHIFSAKDWLSGTYTIDDGFNLSLGADPLSGTLLTERMQVLSLEEIHTFSPTTINTIRAGFSRGGFFADNRPLIPLPASLSFIAGQPVGVIAIGGSGGGGASSSSVTTFGGTQYNPRLRNLFTYSDSVQIVKGKHLLNVGAWLQRVQAYEANSSNSYGNLTFPDLQSFLQGKASSLLGQTGSDWAYSRQWEGAWYVDDTVKVSPNFTMNLGLRHEFTNGWNVHPIAPVNYLPGPNGVLQTQPLIGSSMFTENNAKWLFGPRIGLAWDPFGKGKTSIHAGFGTHYNFLDDLNYVLPRPSSFQFTNFQFPLQVVPGQPLPPGGVPKPYGLSPTNAKTPTVQQWTFLIEQEITASTAVSVGYVGSHGIRFLESSDLNPRRSVICSAPLGNCPAGLADGTKFFPVGSPPLNPALSTASTIWNAAVNVSYNSLQVDLKQRLSKGLTFRANYSFSKALDNGSAVIGTFMTNCPSRLMDAATPLRDYGLACYDIAHKLTFHGSYELPMGPGKAFLGGLSGAAGKLLGGWKLNAIISAQNGMPFTPVAGFANSRDGSTSNSDRPSVNPSFSGPVILGKQSEWFDPHAFVLPPAGTYGNLGRNTLRGPGLTGVDMSLFKDTHIGERLKLEFRAEIFNLLNHANFGQPSISLFSTNGALVGSAAVISNTVTSSRQIQFGLKLAW